MKNIIVISDDMFQTSIMTALEGYSIPHGAATSSNTHTPIEVAGCIWGGHTLDAFGNDVFRVEAMDVHTSAHMTPTGVSLKPQAIVLKQSFNSKYNPGLKYLGDFHSHPWTAGEFVPNASGNQVELKTAQSVEHAKLYKFSSADFASVAALKGSGLDYKIGVVATIFRLKYVVQDPLRRYMDARSAIKFTFNDEGLYGQKYSYRVWMKFYVFKDSGSMMPELDSAVVVHCPAAGFYGEVA